MIKLNQEDLEKKVIEFILKYATKQVDIECVLDTKLADLGIDSFKAINLLIDLEKTFSIAIPDVMLTPELFSSPNSLKEAIRVIMNPET